MAWSPCGEILTRLKDKMANLVLILQNRDTPKSPICKQLFRQSFSIEGLTCDIQASAPSSSTDAQCSRSRVRNGIWSKNETVYT